MLILTRRVGETIIIETLAGERIEVAVLGFKGKQVRDATQAPACCDGSEGRTNQLDTGACV